MKKISKFWFKCFLGTLSESDLLQPTLPDPQKIAHKADSLIKKIDSSFSLHRVIFMEGLFYYVIGFLLTLFSASGEVYIAKFYKALIRALGKTGVETPISIYYECVLSVLGLVLIRSVFSPLGLYFFSLSKCYKSALLQRMAMRKLLNMNMKSQSDTGQLINCISIDVETVLRFYETSHDLIVMPYKFVILALVVVSDLGNAGVFGLLAVFICMGAGSLMEHSLSSIMSRTSRVNDKRANFFHQFISGVKTIKGNRLERYLDEKTTEFSRQKLSLLNLETIIMTIIESVTRLTPLAVSLMVLIYIFYLSGQNDLQEVFFTAISSFSISIGVFINFSLALHEFYCSKISMSRIFEAFFTKKADLIEVKAVGAKKMEGEIKIQKGSFSWEKTSKRENEEPGVLLKEIDLEVKNKDFIIITGKMGAGKSSLVQALLGQMPYLAGTKISVDDSLAFVPQEPFLMTETVQSNITLGEEPIDVGRYKESIIAASLMKDIDSFPQGDMTRIIPGALNISGGQRHRISLARALYHSRNILIVDDVLTSLDVKTGKEIFKALYQRSKRQTVVLIMQILPRHLPKGTKVLELKSNGLHPVEVPQSTIGKESDFELESGGVAQEAKIKSEKTNKNGVIQHQETDSLESTPLLKLLTGYIWRISPWYSVVWICLFIPCQFLAITIEKKFQEFNEKEFLSQGMVYYFGQRALLIIAYIICLVIRNIYNCAFFFKLASSLCEHFLPACFRAPYTFFSDKHKREVESLFTKDLDELERNTHNHVKDLFHQVFRYIGSFSVLCLAVPKFFFPLFGFFAIHMLFLLGSSKSTTRIMALETINKAKALSLVEQATEGSTLLRVMEKSEYIQKKFEKASRDQISVSFNRYLCEILSFQLGFISSGLCGALILTLTFFSLKLGLISVLVVTSGLNYSYTVASSISSISKRSIGAQRSLSCVFNIQNKIKEIPEENYSLGEHLPAQDPWPKSGDMKIQGLCLKYETQPNPVVKELNFSVKHGEKISIVGRTGSGKSSLLSGLIRLLEPYNDPSSSIPMSLMIDGRDIRSVQLADLRDRLGYVSQEVVIFEGTLKENIDPYGRYPREALEAIIKQTIGILRPTINPEFEIAEGGKNLSSGEKQMICFARVLIKKPALVLADEATSSIDEETERVFNENLATLFKNCTVLAITHKPESLVYFEKSFIFGSGKIVKEVETGELLKHLDKYSQLIL